ncbi:DUF6792 domain-containing protein [Gemella cuniculi]|uniref:DUF6792 domain-containing protein n=1 Tax=Gemella cuniculi TaxID=150240 RepID=UPI0004251627|nr:DUF6792 domain-containing protein [Gemella cuniculi]
MFLRFFHNPLLLAKLTYYEYLIKDNKKQTTIEYKIKRIIKQVTGEDIKDIQVYNSGLSTPKLSKNGFQATAIYVPKYNELLVIFRGSERDDISDWLYNYTGIVSGENTSQLDSGLSFVRFLRRKLPDFDNCYKVATGHSLGGHLAITIELLKNTFQRVYTYNTALPQLKQLRKYDKKYNKKLSEYFLEKDLKETNRLQNFTSSYYAKNSHHIYNYIRKNDFIQSLNMTVGTFTVGKTIEFPPVLPKFIDPKNYLTEEDTYELDRIFGGFYNQLLKKHITPDIVKEKQKEIADEFINYLIEQIKDPIQAQLTNLRHWNNKDNKSTSNIKDSYRSFKALYNYMLYLAHSGIIPDDIIKSENSREATNLYEKVLNNETAKSLKNLLKPLQEFYTLIRAIYTLVHVKEFDDLEGWVEIANAHDLTALYDVLDE